MTERERLKIEKEKELRTKGSSRMISEGGMGADQYYDIRKKSPTKSEESKNEKEEEK